MRQLSAVLCAATLGLTPLAQGADSPTILRIVGAAKNLLVSLDDGQRQKVTFPFPDEERSFWHYIPSVDVMKKTPDRRLGLPLREMTATQKHLASALLSAGLSQQGYHKATTIMSLEDILRIIEKDVAERRDPEKYFFSIFGEPSVQGPWGYRIQGHHVSVHFTVVDGKLVGDPTFFGSNPAEVRQGPRQGLRVLAAEEDLGRAVLDSLTPAQKKIAIVAEKAYPDVLTESKRKASLEGQPVGLPAAKMTPAQRQLLTALLTEYVNNVAGEAADRRREKIKAAGQNLSFAWAGVTEKGGPHYYRVQAPTFLIEYDNTQNGANHVHSVWRDFNGDWGEDLLAQHLKQHPH